MRPALFSSLVLFAVAPSLFAESEGIPSPGKGQLGAPLTWLEVPNHEDLVHAVQLTGDGRLFLTPNESFFPKLGLAAEGSGSVPDVDELNGGKSFASIGKWDAGDAAEWGLWLTQPGTLTLGVHLKGKGGRFRIQVGDQSQSFAPSAGDGVAATVSFSITETGRHPVTLTCEDAGSASEFLWMEAGGPAAESGGVLRKRWRPAAAHTKFSSSRATGHVRLWIMELDAVPGVLDFYSPLTTPFGYYGPTWNADGTVNTGFNFSLWSFGRGEAEPPVERLSHLLAIGNPEATFGGFDHEGTGVKIRDWEPLEGRQGQRQALALRVEPGPVYDTYYSYFFASDEKRWRLFGVGNKYNQGRPLEDLWVGSFVEVPGPPPVQRTGAWERRMRYRGWVMDESGNWFPLDRMERGNVDKATGLTHTDRGVTEDGWFYLQTGGWFFRKVRDTEPVALPSSGRPQVDYLDADDLAFLGTVPSEVVVTRIERAGEKARITLSVRNAGAKAGLSLFWGPGEGLTFADRWDHKSESKEAAKEGSQQIILDGVPASEPLFVRVLLRNEEGQFWSRETASSAAR
ncbi:MAG: DUF3472 domain-containing protein [Verrucomicrobiae bacterium]|nr:DUF3472 domain-containing protein [Verrucomicrobiae bacterium]